MAWSCLRAGWRLRCVIGEAADFVGEDWPQFPRQIVAEAREDAEPCIADGGSGAMRGCRPQDLVRLAMHDQCRHAQVGQAPAVPGGSVLPCLRGGVAKAQPAVGQVAFDAFASGGFVERVARRRDGAVDSKADGHVAVPSVIVSPVRALLQRLVQGERSASLGLSGGRGYESET